MNEKKNIAFFTNTYKPVTSGVVRSISDFRQALTDLGHNVFIFAQDSDGYVDQEPFIFRYPAIELPLQEYPLTIPVSSFVNKLLPSLKLDVIHAHHPVLLGKVAATKAQELNVPLVFTYHTRYQEYSHYAALPQDMVKQMITRWMADYLGDCNQVIVPSESIKEIVTELYGIKAGVTAVPTGIDLAPYQAADGARIRREKGWGDDKVLISVGRLAEEKNWKTLIDAVRPIVQERDDVRLIILGSGEQHEELKKYIAELGVGDQVQLPGRVPFNEIPDYLAAADLFCFASLTETQGLVTLEALAAGLPVVAFRATGTADVVEDGVQGLLTDPNTAALTAGIRQALDDEALCAQFKTAALARAQQYEIKNQAKKMLDIYEQAAVARRQDQRVQTDKQKPIFNIDWQSIVDRISQLSLQQS